MKGRQILFYVIISLTHYALSLSDFFKKFHQHDYKIKTERLLVSCMDATFFDIFDIRSFKYNRTQVAINVTIKFTHDVENVLFLEEFYKLSKYNEYRIFPAMRYYLTLSEVIEADVYGFGTVFRRNNPDSGCPFKKNIKYHVGNYLIDEMKSPPFIPTGEYKQKSSAIYLDKTVGTTEFYFTIYRPTLPKN